MVNDNAKTNENNAMFLSAYISKNKAQINNYFNALLSADKDYGIDFKKGSFESDFVLINIDFVIVLLNENCDLEKIDLSNFLYRVRRLDYSSADLLIEIDNLLSAIEKSVVENASGQEKKLNLINDLFVLRSTMSRIYKNVVINTSLFYELSIEKGITGFCQIDNEGKIVYANPNLTTLAEIESDSLEGIPFENFFNGNQKKTVRNILLPENESQQMIQQIEWHTAKGRIVPIGLELSTVHSGPSRIGCYAKITDLTRPMAAQNRIFDELPIGIVKLDKKRSISYTNQNFRDMLGLEIDQWEGKSFESLIPDEKNLQIFEDQLERRFEGKSSQYELGLFRQDDEREISVSVSASPEMSLDGDVIGTIGIIRSIVREKMHKSIEKEKNYNDLLDAIAKELRSEIPFDSFYVGIFSPDEKHCRNFFSYSVEREAPMEKRWWEMTPGILNWATKKKIQIVQDVESFYNQEDFKHLQNDPFVEFVLSYYKSFIYYPVFKNNKVVACAVLYSQSDKPYGPSHRRLLDNLPLKSAILTAIHYDKIETLNFKIDLLREISFLEDDLSKIAHTITKSIAKQYLCENVSIFKINRGLNQFELLSQVTVSGEYRISPEYTQPLNLGILGLVYSEKKSINVQDVNDPMWKGIYVETVKATQSELSIPIESGDLFWILNIEDTKRNAFSQHELSLLEFLISEISVFIERAWLRNYMAKSMEATSDAVIRTDFNGIITEINQAALKLLGYYNRQDKVKEDIRKNKQSNLLGEPFSTILADKEMADHIIRADKIPNTPVSFVKKSGKYSKVLLSKFRLHEEFSTNIIIAKDLSTKDRLEELKYLKKLYSEIAFQTKTPITLISTWLQRIEKLSSDADKQEYIEKSKRKLRHLELSFERMALFDKDKIRKVDFPYNEMLINMEEVISYLKENIPKKELDRVNFEWDKPMDHIKGDLFQITFCFETILSYLFRAVTENDMITVKIFSFENFINCEICGSLPIISTEPELNGRKFIFGKTLLDMALGEPIIRQFINQNSGHYDDYTIVDNVICFKFRLRIDKGDTDE